MQVTTSPLSSTDNLILGNSVADSPHVRPHVSTVQSRLRRKRWRTRENEATAVDAVYTQDFADVCSHHFRTCVNPLKGCGGLQYNAGMYQAQTIVNGGAPWSQAGVQLQRANLLEGHTKPRPRLAGLSRPRPLISWLARHARAPARNGAGMPICGIIALP